MKRLLTIIFALIILTPLPNAASAAAAANRLGVLPAHSPLAQLSETWVLRAQTGEPALLDIEHAAFEHAQLAHDPSHEWRKKSRRSAALPNLSVGVETGYLNRANFNVQDSISVNSSGVTIGPDANNSNQYATNQTMVTARATWSLASTVFHPQALAIEQAIRNRFNDREKISERVSKLYYERLHLKSLLLATRENPRRYPLDRVALMTTLQKVTGELDLITGGWFGAQRKGAGS